MEAKRIMFLINLDDDETLRKWNDLVREHPSWEALIKEANAGDTVIIPNMTFEAAEVIDEWLKERNIERTWLKDNESEYYRVLES